MWPSLIIIDEPSIEVGLQLLNGPVDLFAERDAVELVEQGAMEAFADSVGLRALGLGTGVVDVLDRQVELVFVAFRPQNSVPRSVSTRDRRMPCSS